MSRNRVTDAPQQTPESMLSGATVAVAEEMPKSGRKQMTTEEREARKAALAMESKDAKFARLARQRGIKAVKALRQLQHLANRSQYDWTPEQAANVVKQLDAEVRAIENKFRGSKTNGVTFTL